MKNLMRSIEKLIIAQTLSLDLKATKEEINQYINIVNKSAKYIIPVDLNTKNKETK